MHRTALLAIVGTALYASWPFAAFYTDTLFMLGGLDDWARDVIWKLSLGFLIAGFLVQAVAGSRVDRAFFSRRWQLGAAAVFVGGNLFVVAAGLLSGAQHNAGAVLGFAGAALAGFSSAFFEVGWRAVLYRCDRDAVDVNIALTSVFSRLVIILFVVFSTAWSAALLLVVVAGSPVLMVLCARGLQLDKGRGGSSGVGSTGRAGMPAEDTPAMRHGSGGVLSALPSPAPSRRQPVERRRLEMLEPLLWCGLVVAMFWFSYCVLENMTIPSRMRNYPELVFSMGAGCLLSFVVAMAFLLFRRSLSFATVLRDGVVAMAAVLLVAALALPVEKPVLYVTGSAVQLAVSIMLWISGISFMLERGVSFARVQSIVRLFLYVGVLGASLAWPMLQQGDAAIVLLVLTVVLLGVTVIALGRIVDADHLRAVGAEEMPAVLSGREGGRNSLGAASDPPEDGAGGRAPVLDSAEEDAALAVGDGCFDAGNCPLGTAERDGSTRRGATTWLDAEHPAVIDIRHRRVALVAERFGLSPREQEVFALLVNGRDSVFIRNQLYISKNTVGTHIKSIYRKLGVHSRQELIDVFENGGQS